MGKIIQYRQAIRTKKKVCENFAVISHNVQDITGEENGYTNTYKYCHKLKKRLTTRGCINCVFFKPKS